MSIGNVRQFTVSNNGDFKASIYVRKGTSTPYALSPQIEAGSKISFDLTKVPGLNDGDVITARVSSGLVSSNNSTRFTYTTKSPGQWEARYIVTGTAKAPGISCQGFEPIN